MIRNSAKLAVLGALALVGGAVGLNCSKDSNPSGSGGLKIGFAIPDGTTISSVHYAMTLNGAAGPSGNFNTSDTNSSPSFDIALQPSTNDTITLTATTSTGVSCTTGASPAFSIVSNVPTTVSLTLVCGTGSATSLPGTVDVRANVTTSDNCPNITQVVVAPYQTSVGATIALSAVATDSDAADVPTFTWTSTGGTFATPTGASDTFTCGTAGNQSITLAVNDNHVGGGCTASIILPVNCVAVAGTGTGGTTGAAGAPATGGAPGTGGVVATGGTTGAAGAPATGGTTGTGGVPATGGTTGTGGIAATGGTTGTGGAVVVGPTNEDAPQCVSCETAGKAGGKCLGTTATGTLASAGATLGCDGFASATDRANCLALLACYRSTACQTVMANAGPDFYETGDDPLPCLCNNVSGTQISSYTCQGLSAWTGVCASLVSTAVNGGSVLGNFYATLSPAGIAANLLTCDADASCKSAATCNIPQ
jgi:collagen type VII alpha